MRSVNGALLTPLHRACAAARLQVQAGRDSVGRFDPTEGRRHDRRAAAARRAAARGGDGALGAGDARQGRHPLPRASRSHTQCPQLPACVPCAFRAPLRPLPTAYAAQVPTKVLAAEPLPGAVPLVPLKDLESKLLLRTGEGAGAGVGALGDSGRLAVTAAATHTRSAARSHGTRTAECAPSVHSAPTTSPGVAVRAWLQVTVAGDESDEQLATLCAREAEIDMILLEVPPTLSRLHASRRLFGTLKQRAVELPIIHHLRAPDVPPQELALRLGMPPEPLAHDAPRSHAAEPRTRRPQILCLPEPITRRPQMPAFRAPPVPARSDQCRVHASKPSAALCVCCRSQACRQARCSGTASATGC